MNRILSVVFAIFISYSVVVAAQEKTPLKLVATIPLPGLKDGDFDHFAADVAGQRLFLTDEENDKLDVLDTKTNQRVHTMQDIKAPHAILFRADLKKLFVVEGDASAATVSSRSAKSRSPSMRIRLPTMRPQSTCTL